MKIRALRVLIVVAAVAMTSLHAQQQEDAKQPSKPASFRFEYTLTELNGKQKINARKFEITTGSRGSLTSATKIPIVTASSPQVSYTYTDVGLMAEMESVAMKEGMISLSVEVNESFVLPESASSGVTAAVPNRLAPSIRQFKIRTTTAVKLGVPTVLGTIEDVASTHSFELSVTATPL
jgi:hypothetical protein